MASTKIFTLFAGVNGAGKSTLFSVDTAADLGVRLNTDEIVKERGWDWRDASAQLRAGRELLRRQKECLEKGISFNQETTLSGVSILKAVQTAKERGYLIQFPCDRKRARRKAHCNGRPWRQRRNDRPPL